MGLDIYLYRNTDEGEERIERDSATHPDHLFKIGYFRASYNRSSIDRLMRDRIGTSLADIMGNVNDEYLFVPDWSAALQRATKAKADLAAYIAKNGDYRVMAAGSRPPIRSEAEALAAFLADPKRTEIGWYSTGDGLFMPSNPPRVHAVMAGTSYGSPCAYFIIDGDSGWYMEALDIVAETCAWVLAQPDVSAYALHWSG